MINENDIPAWDSIGKNWVIVRDMWRDNLAPYPGGENMKGAMEKFESTVNESNWKEFFSALDRYIDEAKEFPERKHAGVLNTFITGRYKDVLPPSKYVAPQPKANRTGTSQGYDGYTVNWKLYKIAPSYLKARMRRRAGLAFEFGDCELCADLNPVEGAEWSRWLYTDSDSEMRDLCAKMDLELAALEKSIAN